MSIIVVLSFFGHNINVWNPLPPHLVQNDSVAVSVSAAVMSVPV